jgi:hypothetical protein
VVLEGTVRSEIVSGAPGYGESSKTDSRVRLFYLQLRRPATQSQLHLPKSEAGVQNRMFGVIELYCGSKRCESSLVSHLNKRMIVSGVANWPEAGNDIFFDVNMDVSSLDMR